MAIDFVTLGLDNVLFETEDAHLLACNHAFEKCGLSHHWSIEQFRSAALVHGAAGALGAVTEKLGAVFHKVDAAALSVEKNRVFHELARQGRIALHAGCASLIDEALEDGCKLAIVTDMPAHTVAVLLEQAFKEKVTGMFAAIASAVDYDCPVDNNAYHLVLRTVGADPGRSAAIESAAPGLLAAQRAGLWTLAATPLADDRQHRFISFDALDAMKSASRIHPSFARSTAVAWA